MVKHHSELRGPEFNPHWQHGVVSLSKAHNSPEYCSITRKLWFHPDMTEKMLTGKLNLNTNK